jgi:hypothetical protein
VRKLFILLVLVFVGFLAINRQRVFLRDPLGKVYRNAVPVDGARIFINFSNDVLVEETAEQRMFIVQNWNKIPGTPKALTCFSGMMCLTDADHAEMVPLGSASYEPGTQMSDREVSFNDGSGLGVRVTLR